MMYYLLFDGLEGDPDLDTDFVLDTSKFDLDLDTDFVLVTSKFATFLP